MRESKCGLGNLPDIPFNAYLLQGGGSGDRGQGSAAIPAFWTACTGSTWLVECDTVLNYSHVYVTELPKYMPVIY